MTTPQAWWLVLWGRLKCRSLGRHECRIWMVRGYSVAFCDRCWANRVEVARWD